MAKMYPKSKDTNSQHKLVAITSFNFKDDERKPTEVVKVGTVKMFYLTDACELISSGKAVMYSGTVEVGQVDVAIAAKHPRAKGSKPYNGGGQGADQSEKIASLETQLEELKGIVAKLSKKEEVKK